MQAPSGISIEARLETVRGYHERTKHHLNRYARSLGYLDWANQPDPFRRFEGAPLIPLALPEVARRPFYDSLFIPGDRKPAPLSAASVSELSFYSLALSAWKQIDGPDGRPRARWSLRVNPSSGNLHPTEGYLAAPPIEGICDSAAIYHYAPHEHGLEIRRRLPEAEWAGLASQMPPGSLLVGVTSIPWRESWKYGERAYRYCQHDAGHAIAAVAISAACLGWKTSLADRLASGEIAEFLGVHFQEGIEAEHPDCLLMLTPPDPLRHEAMRRKLVLPELEDEGWLGTPNRLSSEHHPWPVIDEAAGAAVWPGGEETEPPLPPLSPAPFPQRNESAHQIIRQRRSAVALDAVTALTRDDFYRMMARITPAQTPMPFGALPWPPQVSLALFVHRVDGLTPGVYALIRDPSHEPDLREKLRSDFVWQRPEGCPSGVNLYRLIEADAREAARIASCHQEIASDGAFSAGMLARFDEGLAAYGPGMYPRLFWETGAIGQVLYLEAEAAGVRATGIGCFFDDAMHQVLGIEDHSWQSLYHFTMGGPLEDPRLRTIDSYAHLPAERRVR